MSELNQKLSQQLSVFGLPIHLLDDYTSWLISQLHQRQGVHVVTLNAEMVMQANENPALAEVIRQAELVVPDGSGITLYFWLHGQKTQRCPGIELAEKLLEWSVAPALVEPRRSYSSHAASICSSYPIFFYGGSPGVAQQAANAWQEQVPGLEMVGTCHGYLSADEQLQLCQTLKELQPSIIFVGLGVPRQELWIAANRYLCPHAIWIGVGGSFDIWAGVKSRAPGWLRNNHLEWVYRLYQEPWRWRRMLALPRFAWRALIHAVSFFHPL